MLRFPGLESPGICSSRGPRKSWKVLENDQPILSIFQCQNAEKFSVISVTFFLLL